jgi:hypothetical protein
MAQFSGTLEEFHNIVGPKVRNDVATVTKQRKNQLQLVCQHCSNKVNELDAAHKHDSSRKDIIENILQEFKIEEGKYLIQNLQDVLDKIKNYHKSNDVFFFLCKKCHRKYDDMDTNGISKNYSVKKTSNKPNGLKYVILSIFKENSKKFYTAEMIFEIIQKRDKKYYSDTLWGLWKQGFLIHPQRKYYQWNENND